MLQVLNVLLANWQETQRQKQAEETIVTEWMLIALVIDRFLFIVFLVTSSVVLFAILFTHPHYDDNAERFVDSVDPYLRFQQRYYNGTTDL